MREGEPIAWPCMEIFQQKWSGPDLHMSRQENLPDFRGRLCGSRFTRKDGKNTSPLVKSWKYCLTLWNHENTASLCEIMKICTATLCEIIKIRPHLWNHEILPHFVKSWKYCLTLWNHENIYIHTLWNNENTATLCEIMKFLAPPTKSHEKIAQVWKIIKNSPTA